MGKVYPDNKPKLLSQNEVLRVSLNNPALAKHRMLTLESGSCLSIFANVLHALPVWGDHQGKALFLCGVRQTSQTAQVGNCGISRVAN